MLISASCIHHQVDKKSGYAVVSLCKEPVNSMDLTLWQHLSAAIDDCEKDPRVRGIVFTSGFETRDSSPLARLTRRLWVCRLKKNVFTAGLDLKELHAPSTSKER